jgi:hypothetical protein
MNLKIPAWAAIIYAALITTYLTMVYANYDFLQNIIMHIIFTLVFTILSITILAGYIKIAKKTKNKFLKYISYINIILAIIFFMVSLMALQGEEVSQELFLPLSIGVHGIALIIFGIAFIGLKKITEIFIPLSILYFTGGVFYIVSFLGNSIGSYLIFSAFFFATLKIAIPIIIIEAILFFKLSKKYN